MPSVTRSRLRNGARAWVTSRGVRLPAPAERGVQRVRRWTDRHEYLAVTAFLLVVLCLYFWPLIAGGQLGQSHILYGGAPWKSEKPAGLTVLPGSSEGDVAYEYEPLLQVAREQVRDGHVP